MALRENRDMDWVFLALCGASILFLLLPVSGPVQTVRLLVSYVLSPVPAFSSGAARYSSSVPRNVVSLLETDQENRRLSKQVEDQEIALVELQNLREENARLRASLDISQPEGWEGTWSRIVGRDPGQWNRSFLIDKGEQDGVTESTVVLGLEAGRLGLVGRIVEVLQGTSKVLLVTDELSHVTTSVRGTNWEGLASGTGRSMLHVRYLAPEAQLNLGDEILVSPISTVFPRGVPVGTIAKVLPPDPILTFQTVVVEPAVRQERLKEVYLMTRSGGGE